MIVMTVMPVVAVMIVVAVVIVSVVPGMIGSGVGTVVTVVEHVRRGAERRRLGADGERLHLVLLGVVTEHVVAAGRRAAGLTEEREVRRPRHVHRGQGRAGERRPEEELCNRGDRRCR